MANEAEQYIRRSQQQGFETREGTQNPENEYMKKMQEFYQEKEAVLSNQRTLLWFRKEDSNDMREIKSSLADLSNYLSENDISIQKENFSQQLQEVKGHYDKLIEKCTHYISTKNPYTSSGKARLSMVKGILAQAQKEQKALYPCANFLFESASKNQDSTILWINILGEIRTPHINIDNMEIEEVGNGTSQVLKFRHGEEYVYFKHAEKRPSDRYFQVLNAYKMQTEDSRISMVCDKLISIKNEQGVKDFMDQIPVMCASVSFSPKEVTNPEQKEAVEDMIKMIFNQPVVKSICPESIFEDEDFRTAEGFAVLYKIAKDTKKINALANCCADAEIAEGTLISTRNVATSRVANLLGISSLFAKSRTIILERNGKKSEGNLMMEAQGTSAYTLYTDGDVNNVPTIYSPDILRQLTILQIMDSLCGQIDRNLSNILIRFNVNDNGQRVMTDLTAIDNDLSFGNLEFKDIQRNKTDAFKSLVYFNKPDTCVLPAIDKEFYDNFMSLTPEIFEYSLGDLLTRDEMGALKDRFEGIKNLFKRYADNDPDFLVSRDGWAAAASRFISLDDNRSYIVGKFVSQNT